MTFLKNFPSTHRHLFRTNFRLEILQIAHSEDSSIPSRKWDVGANTHPHTPTHTHQRSEDLSCIPLPYRLRPMLCPYIALHNLVSFRTCKWWTNICRNLPMPDYEFQKCHCTNKSVGNHPALQHREMSAQPFNIGKCQVSSKFLSESQFSHFHIEGDGIGFLITRITSSSWCGSQADLCYTSLLFTFRSLALFNILSKHYGFHSWSNRKNCLPSGKCYENKKHARPGWVWQHTTSPG